MPETSDPITTRRMETLLWRETSGVDWAANLIDGWMVLKSRQPSQEATVPFNKDALDDEVKAAFEQLESDVAKAREDQATAEEALAKVTKQKDPAEDDLDDVLKNLNLPEDHPVRKAISDANTRAEAAERIALGEQQNRLTGEFVAKARDLDALSVEPEEFGEVLKSLAEADPENAAKVYVVLKAANAAVSESGAFIAAGDTPTTPVSTDAYGEIETIAKARVVADPTKPLAAAIAEVASERPDLYSRHLAESRKGN